MEREITRIRECGTPVTAPRDGEERIAAIRRIVEEKRYAKVDGCMIDLFSASAIVKVYDALKSENQAKYRGFPAPVMAGMALKLVK